MTDFFTATIAFHRAMFRTTAAMMTAMMKMQSHFLEQQLALFEDMHAARRADDVCPGPATPEPKARRKRGNGKKTSPCCGPDLMNHYGKRAHDVDVEHLR